MRCIDAFAESNESAAPRLRSRMAWYESLALPAVEGCMTTPNKDAWCGCSPRATPGGSDRELPPIRGRGVERDLSRYGCGQCRDLLQWCCAEVNFFRPPRITRLHRGCSPRATPGATDRELLPTGIAGASKLAPTSTTHTTASRLLTESYSRCNKPGATPDRYC